MEKRIFITRAIPEIGIKMLRDKGYTVDVFPKKHVPTQRELISYIKKYPYDAILCLLTDIIDAKVFDAAPTVKLVSTYTVGFNNIDITEVKKRGITVTNTAGASRIPIAEHTLALILGLTTRMVEADGFTKKEKYKGWDPMAFIGTDLARKKLGIIGTGAIGSDVVRMAHRGFDMDIIYYDIQQNLHIETESRASRCTTIEEVLERADIVSLHVPLLDSTHHLINAERLARMKKTAFLINTSRGPVVDENALVEALQKGVIAGAGLDVFEFEPKLAKGLTKLSNVVLTPHIASARQQVRDEMAEMAANNIIDYFEGRTPRNEVKI